MGSKRQRLLDAVKGDTQQQQQQQQQQPILDIDCREEDTCPATDVEAAILFLRDEFKLRCPQLPPLVLHTQLCSLLSDRTSVERGLDECRRRNWLRVFKLATGADEHGIMLLQDYLECVHVAAAPRRQLQLEEEQGKEHNPSCSTFHAQQQQQEERQQQQQQEERQQQQEQQQAADALQQQQWAVARNFGVCIAPNHAEVSISRVQLRDLLATHRSSSTARPPEQYNHHQQQQQSLVAAPLTDLELATLRDLDADRQMSILLNIGVLSRHPADDSTFLLGVPGLGPIIKGVIAGRKELLRVVSKKQYKEMPESQLLGVVDNRKGSAKGDRKGTAQGVRLRSSSLGTNFHLHDLLGKGWLQRVKTPCGAVIRAFKD